MRFAEEQSSRYSQEPIYTPRILREPGDTRNHSGHAQHVRFSTGGPGPEVSCQWVGGDKQIVCFKDFLSFHGFS